METKTQQTIINALYMLLIFSSIVGVVPNMLAVELSLASGTLVLMLAYFFRGRDKEDGLLFNHMVYMIRTIWISSAFLLIGCALAGLWIFVQGDNAVLDNAADSMTNGVMMDEGQLKDVVYDYMRANKSLLILSSVSTIGPAVLYLVYRVGNGFSRAMKGYRIANPQSWL